MRGSHSYNVRICDFGPYIYLRYAKYNRLTSSWKFPHHHPYRATIAPLDFMFQQC